MYIAYYAQHKTSINVDTLFLGAMWCAVKHIIYVLHTAFLLLQEVSLVRVGAQCREELLHQHHPVSSHKRHFLREKE